jgi:FKBP-type peptidyl-prolyl cis-trans isomerase FklB
MTTAALGGCKQAEKKLARQQKDRESYTFGFQTGAALKRQKADVDLNVFASGVRDGLGGAKPRFTEEEMRAVFTDLRKRAAAEQHDKGEKNLAAGKAFLEANKNKEGVKLLPSGVQYKVLKEGTGKMPTGSDTMAVHFRGTLIDGTEFTNSYKQGKPATLVLGRVIPAWKEALPMMREGSKWQLFVPAELAYGQRGTTGIEPNSSLIFEIELLSVSPAHPSPAK